MKTKYIIETAEELLTLANPHRIKGDDTPFVNFSNGVVLVIENDYNNLRLEGAPNYEISGAVTFEDLLYELAKESHLKLHIT